MASLTKLKTLCVEYKKRISSQIAELSAAQKAATANAAEDNQKVPEMSSKEEGDHLVPSKKRKVSAMDCSKDDNETTEGGYRAYVFRRTGVVYMCKFCKYLHTRTCNICLFNELN